VEKDRAYGEKLRDLEDKGEHGASAEYYRMHVYHAVNRKIADLMTYENEFMVKQGKVWKRLGDTPDLKVRTAAINKFLSTASAQDVEHALKHVDPAKAEIVTDLLDRRTSLVDAVEGQIAGHKAKVEAAQEKVKTATAEQANAAAAAELADLKHRSAAPEEQEALKAVLGEAKKLEAAASKRLDTATAALSKFTGKDTSPVPHPFDAGKSIKPPDTHSLANAKEVLRREAEDRAYAKWDKKLASVKQKVAAEVASSKMRYMAIASILAHNGGVRLGAAARAAAVEVEKAHATFMPLERERGRLASALDTLTARAAETKAMGKTVPKPSAPKSARRART
jgi:predicted  nucleic acid-binding Zn-ribbon protein